jgi:predicted ArsR family transcriptional regulator
MLASLVKSGRVRETIKKPEGGGRPSKSYELLA